MRGRFYQVTDQVIVNLFYLHSLALNEDGKAGWLRLVKEVSGKLIIYPITPKQFADIQKILRVLNEQSE